MAWAPSARVVNSTAWLLPKFRGGWGHVAQPNGFPSISMGDALENTGASVAINDLLASVHGHGNASALVLFPGGWPVGEAVSFRRIRVRGAFTVSAAATGTGERMTDVHFTTPVTVDSLAGKSLTLAWPRAKAAPTVKTAGGAAVSVLAVSCGVSGRSRLRSHACCTKTTTLAPPTQPRSSPPVG